MTLEQQMKDALDGKFFYLNLDGQVKCREVGPGFSHIAGFNNNYKKTYASKVGLKPVAVRNEKLQWTPEQIDWLKANIKHKSIRQCARDLNVEYHNVYQKLLAMKRRELREAATPPQFKWSSECRPRKARRAAE